MRDDVRRGQPPNARRARRPPSPCGAFEPRDAAAWDEFVARCPAATFFHRIGWRGDHRGRLPPSLPLPARRARRRDRRRAAAGRDRRAGCSATRWCRCRSPSTAGRRPTTTKRARALIDAAVDDRAARAASITSSCATATRCCPAGRGRISTSRSASDSCPTSRPTCWRSRASSAQWCARASSTASRARSTPTTDRFFALYADNVHRHGTPPYPRRYFARLKETFGDDCEVLTVIDADGTPVSGVLSFYFRDEVLPYYAGDTTAARDLAANDFKYWELMRRACERGLARLRLRPQQARHRLVRLQEELGLRADAARLRVPAVPRRRRAAEQSARTPSTGRSSRCGGICRGRWSTRSVR